MRTGLLLTLLFAFCACQQPTDNTNALEKRIVSLQTQLANTYKPGFGEFMSNIQAHHSKLWFAGQNQNWKLADFEIHEIMESVENIQKYQMERKETASIGMILPVLDSVNQSIEEKSLVSFNRQFVSLTNTCNNCHEAVNFEFNVVKIPETTPFSNQEFKPMTTQ